ncbi:MAG: hypothetical protein V1709_08935 [Planctomycetota bacterium]
MAELLSDEQAASYVFGGSLSGSELPATYTATITASKSLRSNWQ